MPENTEQSYLKQRLGELGITDEHNFVRLWKFDAKEDKNVLSPSPVFSDFKGDINILVYTLQRHTIRISKEGSSIKKDYSIIRYANPQKNKKGDVVKYKMPKGYGTHPFFPPQLLKSYDDKEVIPVLYLTEGYFKAFKACMHDIPTVGLPSITCIKDRNTGKMYGDVLELIKTCKVQRLVWLTDGDCRNITDKELKDGIDIYKRPHNFFSSVVKFHDLASGLGDVRLYFAHIHTENIEGKPKGLDDLLQLKPDRIQDINREASSFDTIHDGIHRGEFFVKMDVTFNIGKVRNYFNLHNVQSFYDFYQSRNPLIKTVEFKFNGTLYKYDEDKHICEERIPRAAEDYIRVGDTYYEFIDKPDIFGNLQATITRRDKTTITDDHGKKITTHIKKYKTDIVVPDHQNFQRVIDGCFNFYHPFAHEAEEDTVDAVDYEITLKFFKHIFGTENIIIKDTAGNERTIKSYELGLDYFTLLYKKPQQILPIICLASREQGTGKSAFVNYLRYVFGQNAAIVSNEDLASNFNAHWASKLLIMCEETKIDKHLVVEKVKALSTGSEIMMNAKGKDQTSVQFFGKFVFCTNNEDNFLPITNEDKRYWVLKVPTIPESERILDIQNVLAEELPAFLSFINHRTMATEKQFRHWFHPDYLKTDALYKVINNSKPQIIKRLYQMLEDTFNVMNDDEGKMLVETVDTIEMPAKDIAVQLNAVKDVEWIRRALKNEGYRTKPSKRGKYPALDKQMDKHGNYSYKIVTHTFHTSYYVFKREDFVNSEHVETDTETDIKEDIPFK